MKKIEAFVEPFTVDAIRTAVSGLGVNVVRVLPAEEFCDDSTHVELRQGTEYEIEATPRVMVVLLVDDDRTESVVRAIQSEGRTDHGSAGRIIVTAVERQAQVSPEAETAP